MDASASITRQAVWNDGGAGHLVLLSLTGQLSGDNAASFADLFDSIESDYAPKAIILDFGKTETPTSAWLGVLVVTVDRMLSSERCVFLAQGEHLRSLFKMIGIQDFVEQVGTVGEALAEANKRFFAGAGGLQLIRDTAAGIGDE